MRRTVCAVHKRIAVTVGVFFLVWLVSGIVMILPKHWYAPVPWQTPAPADFRDITVSPAEAVANLAKVLGSYPEVNSVSLKQIRDTLVYRITVEPDSSHLIDARSGQVYTITSEVAKDIARDEFPGQASVLQIDLVARHGFGYPWGPLPVYRIIFDDDQATVSYVSKNDGAARRTTRLSRIQAAIASFHTFEPLRLITERGAFRKGVLLVLSVVGIGVAGTGYYLALPR